ncbi:MAG TPA: TOBE domain-containing protein [Prolixibacteraceae bacterium]|nr:TOBE domain-containing protein [Prolixibacteraceae bacterium]HPR85622.1 TOBE domain-containing protein [Prolixibacteraceae bacterium]
MNRLPATIRSIQHSEAILLIDVSVENELFSALLIESGTQPTWLREGETVDVVFKETEVSLAKNLSGQISTRNRMKCSVLAIDRGELLSKVKLLYQNHVIYSAITTRSVDSLKLKEGDLVEALLKSNEVSLMKKQ